MYINCKKQMPTGQKISKANDDVVDSSKKWTKLTQDTILSVFLSFFVFGRTRDFMICFVDLLTFSCFNFKVKPLSGLYYTYKKEIPSMGTHKAFLMVNYLSAWSCLARRVQLNKFKVAEHSDLFLRKSLVK